MSKITYNFVEDAASFLPLDAVNGSGTSGVTQNFFSRGNAIDVNTLNIDDALDIPRPRYNNLMQIFYGIAPSYCFVTPEVPGGTILAQMPETSEFPQSGYPYITDHTGFDSPFYTPSKYTELFSLANVPIQFTLANTASIPISPKLLLILNNMTVEPVNSLDLFRKMLEGTVPRRVASVGQVYASVTWSFQVYGNIQPVDATDVLGSNGKTVVAKAGYKVVD